MDIVEPKRPIEGVDYFIGDLAEWETLESVGEFDLVIHSAIIQLPRINEERMAGYKTNFTATKNVVDCVMMKGGVKGLILASSWHVYGEKLRGTVDESYGYHPDRAADRSRLYVFSKIAQEMFVRYAHEMRDDKTLSVVRLGTILGKGMSERTAASIFIRRAVSGEPITPFRDSMYRPMLYVDERDVARAFGNLAEGIISGKMSSSRSLDHIYNLFHPKPITIFELAVIIKDLVEELSGGKVIPRIEVVDRGLQVEYSEIEKDTFRIDVSNSLSRLGIGDLNPPEEVLRRLISSELERIGLRT